MSRHDHKKAPIIPGTGKKAQERQQRQQQGRQKMRLHMFTALALLVLDRWQTNEFLIDDIACLPANERRFLKMQIAKCKKATQAVIRMLHDEFPYPSRSSTFFQDASDMMQDLLSRICNHPMTPKICRYMDVHSVLTYLIYAALNDGQIMETDGRQDRQEVCYMITILGVLSNHLIKNDSPMLQAMSAVFWDTRDMLHSGAALKEWDFQKHPSSAEIYLRDHPQKTA